jgi:N-methylhydantoinase A/oxoprolinase/acetone carboxylase beta subunit
MLQHGPVSVPRLLKRLDIFHPLQSGATPLILEEIIGVSGLTPTDLFHVQGDFTPWNQEAAEIGTRLIATYLGISPQDLIQKVLQQMVSRITREIITYLTGQTLEPAPFYAHPDDLGLWLFTENAAGEDPYLGCEISLKMPLVGIGAPASLLLPQVAEMLHTEYISPPHYQVANAVGAAVGNVITYQEAWVIPQSRNLRTVGYYVQSGGERQRFRTLEEALAFAENITRDLALEQAEKVGLAHPLVKVDRLPDGAESYRIRAVVTGHPELNA